MGQRERGGHISRQTGCDIMCVEVGKSECVQTCVCVCVCVCVSVSKQRLQAGVIER